MENMRREFLKKVTLVSGALAISGVSGASTLLDNSTTFELAFQLGGRSLRNLNSSIHPEFQGKSFLKLVTDASLDMDRLVGFSPDAVLLGRDLQKRFSKEEIKRLAKRLPLVNSNFDGDAEVPKHLIFNKSGLKTGVIGIGFLAGQSAKESILTMNRSADYLKNTLSCDRVVCVTDDPEESGLLLTLQDLAANSANINMFFASTKAEAKSRLFVISNSEKEQTLLHLHSLNENVLTYLAHQGGVFQDYQWV